jgi:uncharacterized membrane-anchored protein YjiN (DUF445 family)
VVDIICQAVSDHFVSEQEIKAKIYQKRDRSKLGTSASNQTTSKLKIKLTNMFLSFFFLASPSAAVKLVKKYNNNNSWWLQIFEPLSNMMAAHNSFSLIK